MALGKPVAINVYIGEQAEAWIHENLKKAKPDGMFHGVESPREQFADVLRRVMTGERIDRFRPKTLVAHPVWVHELRTADLRIFGWFWRKSHFVVSTVELKSRLSANVVTYSGHIQTCCALRDALDLDLPKYIEGEIDDILGL